MSTSQHPTAAPMVRPPIYLPTNRVLAFVPYSMFIDGYSVKLLPRDHADRHHHVDGAPFGIYTQMSVSHKDEIVLDVISAEGGIRRPLAAESEITLSRYAIKSARSSKFQDLCRKYSVAFWPNTGNLMFLNLIDEAMAQAPLTPVPFDVVNFL